MGMTMTQKILAKHAGLPSVRAGQLIQAKLDLEGIQQVQLGGQTVWTAEN